MAKGFKTGGRKKHTPNKLNSSAKQALINVFEKLGGEDGMKTWADTDKREFYKLWGKLVPLEVEGGLKHQFEPLIITAADNG